MHFLCLHGTGANSKVFEMQTAAIRYGLGPDHTYEFIDGAYPAQMAPGIESLTSPNAEFLRYNLDYASDEGVSGRRALSDLQNLIANEGPFDGIMAFSHGAALAATYLIHQQKTTGKCPVLCAVFFCGGEPLDAAVAIADSGLEDRVALPRLMSAELDGEILTIPTAHVWGEKDELYPTYGWALSEMCKKEVRSEFVHAGGHEIPGAKDPLGVQKAVLAIKRMILRAEDLKQ